MSTPTEGFTFSEDPRQRAGQQAVIKLMQTPPERFLDWLDRLEVPWRKKEVNEVESLVISWEALREGEKRNQEAGPFMKSVLQEMKKEIDPNGL